MTAVLEIKQNILWYPESGDPVLQMRLLRARVRLRLKAYTKHVKKVKYNTSAIKKLETAKQVQISIRKAIAQ